MKLTHKSPVVLAFMLTLLAGCMLGPDYVKPETAKPIAYKEAEGWKVAEPKDVAIHE